MRPLKLLFLFLVPALSLAQGVKVPLTNLPTTIQQLPTRITQQQRRVDSLALITRSLSLSGASTSVTVGTTTNLAPGSAPYVGARLNNGVTYLDFGLAPGLPGTAGTPGVNGANGITPQLSVGTVTTGNPGSPAVVTLGGSTTAPVLNLTIPKGDLGATGINGPPGVTPTVTIGSVSTGPAGSSAVVTNSGSSTAVVLNLTIPSGVAGPPGSASGTVTQVNGVTASSGGINLTSDNIPYAGQTVTTALTSASLTANSALSAANSATATGASNNSAISAVASGLNSFTGTQGTRDNGQDSQIAGKLPVSYSATQAATDAGQNSSISSATAVALSALSTANSATAVGLSNTSAILTKADNATVLTGLAIRGVSISDYGGLPGTNINAALSAALNSTASTILIPSSTIAYTITGTNQFSNLSGKTIIATGATILNTTTSLGYLFQNCQKINIQGGQWGLLTMPASNGGNSQHVFQFDQCQGVTLNNRFEIINSAEMGVAFTGCRDVLLDNVYIHNTFRDGAYFRYFYNVTVINSRFSSIKDDAVSLHDKDNFDPGIDAAKAILTTYGVSQSTRATVANNVFTDVYQAVAGIAPKGVNVLTNNIRRTVIAPIAFYQIKNDTVDHAVVSDLLIAENTIDSTNRGATINGTFIPNNGQAATGRAAIFVGSLGLIEGRNQLNGGEVKRPQRITIFKNTVTNSGAHNYFGNLTDVLELQANTFINGSGSTTALAGDQIEVSYSTGTTFRGNKILDTRAVKQHVHGYTFNTVTGTMGDWEVTGTTAGESLLVNATPTPDVNATTFPITLNATYAERDVLMSVAGKLTPTGGIPTRQPTPIFASSTTSWNTYKSPGSYQVIGDAVFSTSATAPAGVSYSGNLHALISRGALSHLYIDQFGKLATRLSNGFSGDGFGSSDNFSAWQTMVSIVSSPVAGDLLYHDGSNWVRLAKGANNQTLKLVSGLPAWADPASSTTSSGDMLRSTYDANTNNTVDNSEALNSQTGAYYLSRANHTGTQPASTITGLGTAATLNAPSSGNAASSEVVKGSDTRLSKLINEVPISANTTLLASDLAAGNVIYTVTATCTITLPQASGAGSNAAIQIMSAGVTVTIAAGSGVTIGASPAGQTTLTGQYKTAGFHYPTTTNPIITYGQ